MPGVYILSVSDRVYANMATDLSGDAAESMLKENGYDISGREVLNDERPVLSKRMTEVCDCIMPDVLLTIGGTGLGKRDVTPEATKDILEKDVPGISEMLRYEGLKKTNNAALSRGVSGIRGNTLIINLPGSTKAVKENLESLFPILEHAICMLKGMGHEKEEYIIKNKGEVIK